jgi:hypothetical protein
MKKMGNKRIENFWEQIRRYRGHKYLFIISNDNNDKAPAWVVRFWDITGYRDINSYLDFTYANDRGIFRDSWGYVIDKWMEGCYTDGKVYHSLEVAKRGLTELWKGEKENIGQISLNRRRM